MRELAYRKVPQEELAERKRQQDLAEARQKDLIAIARRVCDSEDFKKLKIDTNSEIETEINGLINILDKTSFDDLGEAAYRSLHKIKYIKELIDNVEAKAK